jgi:hypothetical protein
VRESAERRAQRGQRNVPDHGHTGVSRLGDGKALAAALALARRLEQLRVTTKKIKINRIKILVIKLIENRKKIEK